MEHKNETTSFCIFIRALHTPKREYCNLPRRLRQRCPLLTSRPTPTKISEIPSVYRPFCGVGLCPSPTTHPPLIHPIPTLGVDVGWVSGGSGVDVKPTPTPRLPLYPKAFPAMGVEVGLKLSNGLSEDFFYGQTVAGLDILNEAHRYPIPVARLHPRIPVLKIKVQVAGKQYLQDHDPPHTENQGRGTAKSLTL